MEQEHQKDTVLASDKLHILGRLHRSCFTWIKFVQSL